MGSNEEETVVGIHWENRTLCSDEACIGIIGPNGRCKECGKLFEGKDSGKDLHVEAVSDKETGWEKVLPREEDDLETIREEIPPQRTGQVLGKTPSPEIKPALVQADAESIEPAVAGKEILPKDLVFGIQDLRKAVIWSEILAPPLALRDE